MEHGNYDAIKLSTLVAELVGKEPQNDDLLETLTVEFGWLLSGAFALLGTSPKCCAESRFDDTADILNNPDELKRFHEYLTATSYPPDFVGIKFCQEWFACSAACRTHTPRCSNNMLYPKEDKRTRKLMYIVCVVMHCVHGSRPAVRAVSVRGAHRPQLHLRQPHHP